MSPLSHDLSTELMTKLGEECAPGPVIAAFARQLAGRSDPTSVESAGREVFGDYGTRLMQRTVELGEQYTDRTYEVLKAAAHKTGRLFFPHVAQRFVEIAYLATQEISTVDIVENNHYRLINRVTADCVIYRGIGEACGGAVADQMPCRHACLSALCALYDALDLDVDVSQAALISQDGHCRFVAANNRPHEGTPWKTPSRESW